MTAPLCICGCGRELVKHSYETLAQWERRLKSGLYRARCKKNLPLPLPSPKERTLTEPVSWNHERPDMTEQPKEKRIDDPSYESWIRELPCIIPHCQSKTQSHHQQPRGKGGTGTKPSSYRCLPVCAEHHTLGGTPHLPGSYHGMGKLTGWKFWKHYGVEVETVIHDLNRAWLEMGRKFKEG
jgi:hypothetical protein